MSALLGVVGFTLVVLPAMVNRYKIGKERETLLLMFFGLLLLALALAIATAGY